MRFRSLAGIAAIALVAIAVANAGPTSALPATTNGSVRVLYHVPPSISLTLTTNYQTGFGPQGGAGSGSTPSPGPGTSTGAIDFGTVVQGYNYLYKYAAQVAVMTNDVNGFVLYAEGTSDFDATFPLQNSLFWMPSSANNTPYTGPPTARSFQKTLSPVTLGANSASINYGGAAPNNAAQIWQYNASTVNLPGSVASQGYDYQLDVPSSTNISSYSIYVVYTAVAS
jgi:hypothetical protein